MIIMRNKRLWAKKHNYRKQKLTKADLEKDAPRCNTCKNYVMQLTVNNGQCREHRMNLVCWNAVCDCYEKGGLFGI